MRRRGIGRRLVETIELEAMTLGARTISLGAADESRGFWERLGYRGKHAMRQKDLPGPGRVLDARLAKMREAAGDLDVGYLLV